MCDPKRPKEYCMTMQLIEALYGNITAPRSTQNVAMPKHELNLASVCMGGWANTDDSPDQDLSSL